MKQDELKKNMDKLWKYVKKDLQATQEDMTRLLKSSEVQIKELSVKSKIKLEEMSAALEREKLYYDLGKTVSAAHKKNKKFDAKSPIILKKIRSLDTKIKKLQRLQKQQNQQKKK